MEDNQPAGLSEEFQSYSASAPVPSYELLTELISEETLVGDVLKTDFAECEVLVHDFGRQKVGGLPLGAFLLASRMSLTEISDPHHEEPSLILLRVVGQARLPNAGEADEYRFMAGQRAADSNDHWDAAKTTDRFTQNKLGYAGVRCRVLGTFRVRSDGGNWQRIFGADISNFYSGRGLKAYKPTGDALSKIVNHSRVALDDSHILSSHKVPVGRVRYSSTEFGAPDEIEHVEVSLVPADLVARRTALFGMSRTGKSNTTKVIASSVYKMREKPDGRVGQLIFDVNGEYANENTQDSGDGVNASCLKNVWQTISGLQREAEISTYGLTEMATDPDRKIVKVNFFGAEPATWIERDNVTEAMESLLVGKMLIDEHLVNETTKYMKNFRNTDLTPPLDLSRGPSNRYHRAITIYRSVLNKAGLFAPPTQQAIVIKGWFSSGDFRKAIDAVDTSKCRRAAALLKKDSVTWDEMFDISHGIREFLGTEEYRNFNSDYQDKKEGRSWDDDTLQGVLSILEYPNGVKALVPMKEQHHPSQDGDYATQIVKDLQDGKLVIFDQATGDPSFNKAAAERIMQAIFNEQKRQFIQPEIGGDGQPIPPKDVLVYAEEAHNLLPANSAADTTNIWSRAAKEGSKYHIGLVYATQEPSSIQSNIMKNTDNWFVAHLNNSDETRELRKYYDFEDFVPSILQVPDPGFIRMRTLSNPYIVPVQVKRFTVQDN